MSPMQRRAALWGALGVTLAIGLGYAFRPRPVLVDLTEVSRGVLRVTIDEEGETRVRDVFVLSAPVAGRARRIEVEAGEAVIAGESLVAEIEPADPTLLDARTEIEGEAAIRSAEAALELARAQTKQAEAELDFARAELERQTNLSNRGIVSERELDAARREFRTRRAALDTALAGLQQRSFELDRARARLVSARVAEDPHGHCECIDIRAPVSGRVLRVVRESEGIVQAGEPLVEIGDPRDLEIVVDLLSMDAVRVEPDMRVLVDEWGGDTTLSGHVRTVEPFGFTKVSALGIEEQRVNVIVDLDAPPESWERLGHGYRVEARIVLWEGEDVIVAPISALFRHDDGFAVFTVEDGVARIRAVEPGRQSGLQTEIVSGLEPGDVIVRYPNDGVADGARVAAR